MRAPLHFLARICRGHCQPHAAHHHDIGKIEKAEYYVENQRGVNPHERLQPSMSALIVAVNPVVSTTPSRRSAEKSVCIPGQSRNDCSHSVR
jgi:hypothetical protein